MDINELMIGNLLWVHNGEYEELARVTEIYVDNIKVSTYSAIYDDSKNICRRIRLTDDIMLANGFVKDESNFGGVIYNMYKHKDLIGYFDIGCGDGVEKANIAKVGSSVGHITIFDIVSSLCYVDQLQRLLVVMGRADLAYYFNVKGGEE